MITPDRQAVETASGQLRDRLLTATAEAAAELLRSLSDATIQHAIGTLGDAAQVSRVYIFEIHPDARGQALCSQRHEWCAPGVEPQINNPALQHLPMAEAGFGRWLSQLSAEQTIAGDIDDFPLEEQPILRAQGIVSLTVVPVHIRDQLWGFIGFDECQHAGKWTHEVIECLRITARVLAGAIDRLSYLHRHDQLMADHQQLIDSLDEIVFRFDAAGRWTLLSAAWDKRLGWDAGQCLGRPAVKYVHPADRAKALRSWVGVQAARQQSFRGELRFRQANGEFRWMLVSARAQRDESSRVIGVTGTLTDIAAAKAAEAELIDARAAAEAASRSKSEFLSTMSHELRTPLNAVIGLSESLLDESTSLEAARVRRYLEMIHSSGRQLLTQINDILDFVRIDAGRVQIEPSRFDLGILVANAIEAVRRELNAKSLRTEIHRPKDPLWVEADQRLLNQALHYILNNAIKFTPASGLLVASVSERPEGGVKIAMRDSGIGIPPAQLDRLFEPFSQADASLSRPYRGTGLGLSLVERIVRLHGGSVSVASSPGAGSTFTIELPPSVLAAPIVTRSAPAAESASRRVLLVDADVNQHTILGDYLQRQGWEVVHCDRSETALATLDTRPPALAIVDVHLPGISGLELIARLRAAPETKLLPIIAIAALATHDSAQRCRAVGANLFLAKPIALRALSEHIQQLTGRPVA
jgi:PAS domain S-box-containing protein